MNSQNGSVFENKTEKNIEEVTLLLPLLTVCHVLCSDSKKVGNCGGGVKVRETRGTGGERDL